MSPSAQLCATSNSFPHSKVLGTPLDGKGYVATRPLFGLLLILSLSLKRLGTLGGTSYVATRPTCGPLLILSPAVKCWGHPKRQCLSGHQPSCGPLMILPPALKRWGPFRRQGPCTHPANLWDTFDCFSRS